MTPSPLSHSALPCHRSRSKSLASKSSSLASASKSLASKSNSLASKATAAASKASSLASQSASCSSAAAASSLSASQASLSLASQQKLADASAASLASAASANSAAAASLSSAQVSLSSAASAFSASVAGATASAGAETSAIALARSSLSADAASITSAAASVSSASADAASSASALSAKSAALDSAAASLSSDFSSVVSSFGSVSSSLSSQSDALAASTSAYAGIVSSLSLIQSEQSVAATALAASAASIASQTSSLAAAATASGLATACLLPTYLGNGHCYRSCPDAYPVQFTRDNIYGLCCAPNSYECINASPTGLTVCADTYLLTVLDQQAMSGTCTSTCCTVEDGVAYQFKQLGGVYEECVAAQDCVNGAETADPASGLCCDEDVATCQDNTPAGALSCTKGKYFTPRLNSVNSTGTCAASCASGTFYSGVAGANACLAQCPLKTGFFPGPALAAGGSTSYCCVDVNAMTCSSATVVTACVAGFALTSAGKCVATGSCPNGAADSNGVCCANGALTCISALVATACGQDKSLSTPAQTFLTLDGKCVPRAGCPNGASVPPGTQGGVCCADAFSLTCASAGAGQATSCDSSANYYLHPSSGGTSGSCIKFCAGSFLDRTTSTCVDTCPSGSSFTDPATALKTCCAIGQDSCDGAGTAQACSKAAGYFLQPDGKSCAKTCPSNSVKAASGGLCCAKGTSDCTSVALTGAAIQCTSAYYFFDQTCLGVCGPRTIPATVGSVKTCQCTDQHVATCGLDGVAQSCDANYSMWTPPDGSAPSCEKTCPANTQFDYASSNRGTCKCITTASNHVQSCDVATGYPTTCASSFSVFTPSDPSAAPTCQKSCVAGTEFDSAKSPGACKCTITSANHVNSCNVNTGNPTACQGGYAVFTPSNSAVAPTCQAACGTGYAFDASNTNSPGTCVCTSPHSATCDAAGIPQTCVPNYSLFVPTNRAVTQTCQFSCTNGFIFDLVNTWNPGTCSQCYSVNNFAPASQQNYFHPDTVTTCETQCRGFSGYSTAWHSNYAPGGQVHCTCFTGTLSNPNSFGQPADRSFCNKYDANGVNSGAEYLTYYNVRLY